MCCNSIYLLQWHLWDSIMYRMTELAHSVCGATTISTSWPPNASTLTIKTFIIPYILEDQPMRWQWGRLTFQGYWDSFLRAGYELWLCLSSVNSASVYWSSCPILYLKSLESDFICTKLHKEQYFFCFVNYTGNKSSTDTNALIISNDGCMKWPGQFFKPQRCFFCTNPFLHSVYQPSIPYFIQGSIIWSWTQWQCVVVAIVYLGVTLSLWIFAGNFFVDSKTKLIDLGVQNPLLVTHQFGGQQLLS